MPIAKKPPTVKKTKPKKVVLVTSRGLMVSALRKLWSWSIEKRLSLQRDNNTCQVCGIKASKVKGKEVKVETHHLQPGDINWDRIERVLRAELFCGPEGLITLCKAHHLECHRKGEL